jgi:hypothetical protein
MMASPSTSKSSSKDQPPEKEVEFQEFYTEVSSLVHYFLIGFQLKKK